MDKSSLPKNKGDQKVANPKVVLNPHFIAKENANDVRNKEHLAVKWQFSEYHLGDPDDQFQQESAEWLQCGTCLFCHKFWSDYVVKNAPAATFTVSPSQFIISNMIAAFDRAPLAVLEGLQGEGEGWW